MRFVRVWLPILIMVGGVVAIVVSGGTEAGWEGGVAIIAAGASVWLLNIIFRVGVQGERDRDAEDAARDFYGEHGYWPDEAPPPGAEPLTERPADPHRSAPHDHHESGRPGSAARRPPRRP